MPQRLPSTHRILERPLMEFRPFGRDPKGQTIQDVSGITVRANLEYLIGVARGKGTAVWIHPNSDLFTSQWQSGAYGRQDPKEAA